MLIGFPILEEVNT